MNCVIEGCANAPTLRVMLKLRSAPATDGRAHVYQYPTGMNVCGEHRDSIGSVSELFDEENFAALRKRFEGDSLPPPVAGLSEVIFEPITEPPSPEPTPVSESSA